MFPRSLSFVRCGLLLDVTTWPPALARSSWHELLEHGADPVPGTVDGSLGGIAQQRFQLGERRFRSVGSRGHREADKAALLPSARNRCCQLAISHKLRLRSGEICVARIRRPPTRRASLMRTAWASPANPNPVALIPCPTRTSEGHASTVAIVAAPVPVLIAEVPSVVWQIPTVVKCAGLRQ